MVEKIRSIGRFDIFLLLILGIIFLGLFLRVMQDVTTVQDLLIKGAIFTVAIAIFFLYAVSKWQDRSGL
ncbi:hypothetical protein C499_06105 [Halogeometricum borinquense DSM 11551]|uniref:Uncharacterized protein n=2 Tax=Halogeometricum borinquense TaxID=60847 RepID=E4NVA1_HALBP|nr:hypothetical protein Hbor_35700 [Halogeometricum borinquense DSM 11551]ELY29408.1 hypothetical protein C499_06105 [Halogeometricum borinquense DSM 11551]RYJ08262.1 hypothetical protein ELS19_17025 [Halogeometricum borinquense]